MALIKSSKAQAIAPFSSGDFYYFPLEATETLSLKSGDVISIVGSQTGQNRPTISNATQLATVNSIPRAGGGAAENHFAAIYVVDNDGSVTITAAASDGQCYVAIAKH